MQPCSVGDATSSPYPRPECREDRRITLLSAESEYVPQTPVELPEDKATEVLKIIDLLEQDEDVQRVFHNLA